MVRVALLLINLLTYVRSVRGHGIKHESVTRSHTGLTRTGQEDIWKASSHCAVESQQLAFVRLLFHVQAMLADDAYFSLPSCRAEGWRTEACSTNRYKSAYVSH